MNNASHKQIHCKIGMNRVYIMHMFWSEPIYINPNVEWLKTHARLSSRRSLDTNRTLGHSPAMRWDFGTWPFTGSRHFTTRSRIFQSVWNDLKRGDTVLILFVNWAFWKDTQRILWIYHQKDQKDTLKSWGLSSTPFNCRISTLNQTASLPKNLTATRQSLTFNGLLY